MQFQSLHRRWMPAAMAALAALLIVSAVVLRPSSTLQTTAVRRKPILSVGKSAGTRSVNLSAGATPPEVPPPTGLQIPAIGVNTSIVDLGLNPDGSAAVPATTTEAGWYDLGPRPGDSGPAVILGHVDSYTGPGVFFRLKDLLPGDVIRVQSGVDSEKFVVQNVELFSKTAFPTEAVFGPIPQNALRLVTCGGPFDTSVRSYEDNWVVFAAEEASH